MDYGVVNQWIQQASEYTAKFTLLGHQFIDDQGTFENWVFNQMAMNSQIMTESTFLLIQHKRLWDAEILIRSITEGTMKMAFMGIGSQDEIKQKVDEFYNVLPEISELKNYKRLSDLLAFLDDGSNRYTPYRELIKLIDIEALEQKYSKKIRQPIEQRWSFSEMIKKLSQDYETNGFMGVDHLSFGYGVGSHLAHQDADAINLIWDRHHRDEKRRSALELAHSAREISDLMTMAMIRGIIIFKVYNSNVKPIIDLYSDFYSLLGNQLQDVYQQWWDIEYKA